MELIVRKTRFDTCCTQSHVIAEASRPSPEVDVRSALPAQRIDATPSGIKLILKVVSMTPEKRFGLRAAQKSNMWRRWKAGESLHEIGRRGQPGQYPFRNKQPSQVFA
jgi:hypothetical protein